VRDDALTREAHVVRADEEVHARPRVGSDLDAARDELFAERRALEARQPGPAHTVLAAGHRIGHAEHFEVEVGHRLREGPGGLSHVVLGAEHAGLLARDEHEDDAARRTRPRREATRELEADRATRGVVVGAVRDLVLLRRARAADRLAPDVIAVGADDDRFFRELGAAGRAGTTQQRHHVHVVEGRDDEVRDELDRLDLAGFEALAPGPEEREPHLAVAAELLGRGTEGPGSDRVVHPSGCPGRARPAGAGPRAPVRRATAVPARAGARSARATSPEATERTSASSRATPTRRTPWARGTPFGNKPNSVPAASSCHAPSIPCTRSTGGAVKTRRTRPRGARNVPSRPRGSSPRASSSAARYRAAARLPSVPSSRPSNARRRPGGAPYAGGGLGRRRSRRDARQARDALQAQRAAAASWHGPERPRRTGSARGRGGGGA
jgi:hypothetical protein